ncbi:MAG TPA: VWA domain-containing protein [Pararhizobium sp.]|nr:VWA domain-containing protein [Pararhizobium sp.]
MRGMVSLTVIFGRVLVMRILARLLVALALLGLATPAMAADRAVIILDGSGSMWGRIDGKPKLEIARDTLRTVLRNVPAGLELGLMAYGHREKGNCADIEMLVSPKVNAGPEIIAAADKMKFLGKTPISAAVRKAADTLRFTEDKATVILITDGIETCEADPCAVAAELEERGLDFTAHVVGLGLTADEGRQVSCLAKKTGGKYFQASNAAELTDAMNETVAQVEPVPLIEPKAEPSEHSSATLEAQAEVPAGSAFEVTWTGPDNKQDYITIVEKGAPEGTHGNYTRTRSGSPLKVTAPDAVGAYELRYVVAQSKRVLASREIALVPTSATLDAPVEVPAGSAFEVAWTGPDNDRDYITIVEKGAPEGTHGNYTRTRNGSPLTITAPDAVGAYELRYIVAQSKRVLASREVVLIPTSATVKVENTAVPGGKLTVAWTGPDNRQDYITIVEKGAPEGTHGNYTRTRSGSPLTIEVPKKAGAYEVRYVVAQSKRVLASAPLNVADAQATLSAPPSVAAGGTVEVEWAGPANWEDFIQIVPAGAKADSKPLRETRTSQGSPLSIFAPSAPGEYRIRYKMRATGEVAAEIPLFVE